MQRIEFLQKLQGLLFCSFLNINKTENILEKPILNVFLAVDLSEEKRKKDRLADLRAMEFFFRSKGEIAGMSVKVQSFYHTNFTIRHISEAIKKIGNIEENQPKNSGIVFYFSGHGANFGDDAFPHLSIGNDKVAVNKLNSEIGACNPRLRFILADCCNNFIQGVSNIPNTANPTDEELVKKLFWNFGGPSVKKTVLICAAEKGDYSYSVDSGSIFQQMFRKAFYQCTTNDNVDVSWEQIKSRTFEEVKKILDKQTKSTGIQYGQKPIFRILSTPDI